MAHGHEDGSVVWIPLKEVKAGMVRAWNEGRTSLIYKIEKETPRSRTWFNVSYQSTEACEDGHKNTLTLRASGELPIIKDSIENPLPLPTLDELVTPLARFVKTLGMTEDQARLWQDMEKERLKNAL